MLAGLKHLAQARLASVTFFETAGWRGIMETDAGSPLPGKFRSTPGAVFPLYHVLADISEFAGGQVVFSQSQDHLAVEVFALRKAARARVLLANLSHQPQTVRLPWRASAAHVRCLDESNALAAMTEPERFRLQPGKRKRPSARKLELELLPYALARIDGPS
jgi:hypothetical protein